VLPSCFKDIDAFREAPTEDFYSNFMLASATKDPKEKLSTYGVSTRGMIDISPNPIFLRLSLGTVRRSPVLPAHNQSI
jgi:hypothetical protein